jgi:hypothetical protein
MMMPVDAQPSRSEAFPDAEQAEHVEDVPASPSVEPRSLGEALSAATQEREQTGEEASGRHAVEDVQPEQTDVSEERIASPDDLRDFLAGGQEAHFEMSVEEPTVEPVGYDQPLEQSEPLSAGITHAPSMGDLRALLTDPEWRASVPGPPDLGPLVPFGERMIPAALLEMRKRGYIKDWS